MIGEYPLVGRREELAKIRRLLSGRRSSGVVIAAAAGVGKTRLATEAARTVEHHLQHVYHKLGVSDRRQLEGIIRPSPAPARVRRAGA